MLIKIYKQLKIYYLLNDLQNTFDKYYEHLKKKAKILTISINSFKKEIFPCSIKFYLKEMH